MDEQTTRSKSPNKTINFPEATSPKKQNLPATRNSSPKPTEAGAEPPSGSRILGQDDRWMSRQRALNPQTKPSTSPKPPLQKKQRDELRELRDTHHELREDGTNSGTPIKLRTPEHPTNSGKTNSGDELRGRTPGHPSNCELRNTHQIAIFLQPSPPFAHSLQLTAPANCWT